MLQLIRQHWRFFTGYFFFLLLGGGLQLLFSQTELFLFINSQFHPFADWFFKYWTFIGDGWFSIAVALILLLFFSYKDSLLVATAYTVSSILAQTLKRVVFSDSLRPKSFFEGKKAVLHFTEGVEVFSHNSFPSGHSASAFALFCVFCFIFGNKTLEWLWLLMALLVAYSRMYLAEHFFEDVYAGSVLGVITAVILQYFFMKMPEKNWHQKSVFKL